MDDSPTNGRAGDGIRVAAVRALAKKRLGSALSDDVARELLQRTGGEVGAALVEHARDIDTIAVPPSGASGGSQAPGASQLDWAPRRGTGGNELHHAGVRREAASDLAIVRRAAEREPSQVNTSRVPSVHVTRVADLIAGALAFTAAGGMVVSMGSTPEQWSSARWHWWAIALAAVGSTLMHVSVALAPSGWRSKRLPARLVTGGFVIIAGLTVGDLANRHELTSLWETLSSPDPGTVAAWLAYECCLCGWCIVAANLRRRAKPKRA